MSSQLSCSCPSVLLLSVVMSYVNCGDYGVSGLMIVRVELSTMSVCTVCYTPW